MPESSQYVAAVDIGSTVVKCHIYNKKADIVSKVEKPLPVVRPQPGYIEIDPVCLWNAFIEVIKAAIAEACLNAEQISCLGISTQRGTFITWDSETGEHFHNFITWNDLRASHLVNEWNNSLSMKAIRFGAGIMHMLTRQQRYLAASVLQLATKQANVRLVWALKNIPELKKRAEQGRALFGTIDTWLLWKLTGGKVHATDYSIASCTALYDPFVLEWAPWAFNLFHIPMNLMPEVKDTSGHFGDIKPDIFGASIPITAMAGDQQAAMFGQCCFNRGEVKCTIGTGAFLNLNTGKTPHASMAGLYPVVGWKIKDEITYLAEGSCNDAGTAVTWATQSGLLSNPSESSDLATSIPDSGGCYFVPGFTGLQAPFNDDQACAGFIGISHKTQRAHMVRAILESIAFCIFQLYHILEEETNFVDGHVRVDGGVSKNDFVMQMISDLVEQPVDRPHYTEMSCLGVAFLAGLATGVWRDKKELQSLRFPEVVFKPKPYSDKTKETWKHWSRAVARCQDWYPKHSKN